MPNTTLQIVQTDGVLLTIPNAQADVISQAQNAMIRQEGMVEFIHQGRKHILAGRHIIRVVFWDAEDESDIELSSPHTFGIDEI